ncbi:acetolactate synthase large subunit, partial [Francisella tularensis subsp. holarctica]|nr:acetolactate synthase large subunit [Francisella tularensis subsp. holarctica]
RPCAVLIDITKYAQVGMMEYKEAVGNKQGKWIHKPIINMDDILKASEYINNANKPILITGHGLILSGAEDDVLKLA